MTTNELDFQKTGEFHRMDGMRYSLDAVIDLLNSKPREVESFSLDGWYTDRRRWGLWMQSVLIGPMELPHAFTSAHVQRAKPFPILVCKRGRRIYIVDGIHRTVKALRAKKTAIPCIWITYRELQKCTAKDDSHKTANVTD